MVFLSFFLSIYLHGQVNYSEVSKFQLCIITNITFQFYETLSFQNSMKIIAINLYLQTFHMYLNVLVTLCKLNVQDDYFSNSIPFNTSKLWYYICYCFSINEPFQKSYYILGRINVTKLSLINSARSHSKVSMQQKHSRLKHYKYTYILTSIFRPMNKLTRSHCFNSVCS